MIELTCFKEGKVEKHRRLFLRSDIKGVIEMPDTKEVIVLLRGRRGIFGKKNYTQVTESFEEVRDLLNKSGLK